jgi:hypothetical protein
MSINIQPTITASQGAMQGETDYLIEIALPQFVGLSTTLGPPLPVGAALTYPPTAQLWRRQAAGGGPVSVSGPTDMVFSEVTGKWQLEITAVTSTGLHFGRVFVLWNLTNVNDEKDSVDRAPNPLP